MKFNKPEYEFVTIDLAEVVCASSCSYSQTQCDDGIVGGGNVCTGSDSKACYNSMSPMLES